MLAWKLYKTGRLSCRCLHHWSRSHCVRPLLWPRVAPSLVDLRSYAPWLKWICTHFESVLNSGDALISLLITPGSAFESSACSISISFRRFVHCLMRFDCRSRYIRVASWAVFVTPTFYIDPLDPVCGSDQRPPIPYSDHCKDFLCLRSQLCWRRCFECREGLMTSGDKLEMSPNIHRQSSSEAEEDSGKSSLLLLPWPSCCLGIALLCLSDYSFLFLSQLPFLCPSFSIFL